MPDNNLANLNCSVVLIHSVADKVINKVESEYLYRELRQHHIKARLLITPLLDHTNLHFSMKAIKQVVRLLKTFNWFLKNI